MYLNITVKEVWQIEITNVSLRASYNVMIIKSMCIVFLQKNVNVFNLKFLQIGRKWRNVKIRNMFEFQAFAVKQKT